MFSAICGATVFVASSALAQSGRLSPQDFNKMYYLARNGKVGILREAVNRGLNIDTVNPNGDTGLCIAVKKQDYIAYNTFRMSGANPKHPCTYKIYDEYQEFLESDEAAHTDMIVGNEESLHYVRGKESSWWPWIFGGLAVGGGAWALSSGGSDDKEITVELPPSKDIGLVGYLNNCYQLVSSGVISNASQMWGQALLADNVDIRLLPNALYNAPYLNAYVKIVDGMVFQNKASKNLTLGNASVGLAAYGEGSQGVNEGSILLDARNGTIAMAASNGAEIVNNSSGGIDASEGKIDIVFRGANEGDAVIGMYVDTGGKAVNYGVINGTTSKILDTGNTDTSDDILSGLLVDLGDEGQTVTSANSGSVVGMGVFDFYTGENNNEIVVQAQNQGKINLSAGYNAATDVSVNLVGMGSYIDDKFLNGTSNPLYAEQMQLLNYGDISLKYDGVYKVSNTALKLGDGGLIGMRADASTGALNRGNINIALTATETSQSDVSAGMLALHGADLVNGMASKPYLGSGRVGGTITILNEAKSGGVSYGMLAAKGAGTQTKLYKWKKPKLYNYGLIDMQTSNSFAMASFDGGEVVNNGVINLGVELGHSYYKNNYGLYAAGGTVSEEVMLSNAGIINVYSEQSTAIYNAFNGSVSLENNGLIYVSNKATGSKVFGGNFSKAVNNGTIFYKAGNSENFTFPTGSTGDVGFNEKVSPIASVIQSSSNDDTTKQYVVNNGDIVLGAERSEVDYGGTYGTASIQISKQGSAENNGNIVLDRFDKDIVQMNVGIWLDTSTTAESYANNKGNIVVLSANSTAIRNDSKVGAQATNEGNIWLGGWYGHGMAVTDINGSIFNGRYRDDKKPEIHAVGGGSVGMYVQNGKAWNYGTILLEGDETTGIQLSGADAQLLEVGDIVHKDGLEDVTYFWLHNNATREFDYPSLRVEGYTLAKATQKGNAYFSAISTGYVSGANSHLLVAEDSGNVYNMGKVYALDKANAIVARKGGKAYNYGYITVEPDSVGMLGEDKSSYVETFAGSKIYVEGGTGISANNFAEVENEGDIIVNKGIGIYLTDGSVNTYTQGTNDGSITVRGKGNIGVKVVNGARFINDQGNISVSSGAQGVYSTSKTKNSGEISVTEDAIGIYAVGGSVENTGTIDVSGSNAKGIDNLGAKVENSGKINVAAGTGVYGSAINYGTIEVSSDAVGVEGYLENKNGTVQTHSTGIGLKGSGINTGKIIANGSGAAVLATGSFSNSGTISASSLGVHVDGGSFENTGSVTVTSGNAVYVTRGNAVNYDSISVGNGVGMYVDGILSSAVNEGNISVTGAGYGAYVENSGSFINVGSISFDSEKGGHCANIGVGGECLDASEKDNNSITTTSLGENATQASLMSMDVKVPVYVGKDATFINKAEVDFGENEVDFDAMRDESGSFVLADGGMFKAETLRGHVVASTDIVLNGFQDTYVAEKAFRGKNTGLDVASQSYLFEAGVKDNGDDVDVELNRKKFEEVLDEKDLASFWETNYQLQKNEKIYNALKTAETKEEFKNISDVEVGKNFYANLSRENMAVLRGLNTLEQNRLLENGVNGAYAGADYYRTGKEGQGLLSGYADDIYSLYAGYGEKVNKNWSVGGTLRLAYADATYDDAHSSRHNNILLATLPVLYQNGDFKFLTTPAVGLGFGEYERRAISGGYEADTFDVYYGMYNHAEYSVDMKVAELVMEAELNLQGSSMAKAKEDNEGLNLASQRSLSLESGIGFKLRKRIELAKQRSLMLAVGVKYYHEFLDPYDDLKVGMSGSPVSYRLNGYNENKDRLRTSAEAVYKDGDFSVAAEIAHNLEKENNVEGGVGVRYNF